MTAPETRTIPRKFPREDVTQQAIPWCTTHDLPSCPLPARFCYEAYRDPFSCSISTGGPDHKWWRDQ